MTKGTKIYVCGPMSGIPKFNYPLFERVTAELRQDELDTGRNRMVVNPAEEDSPLMQDLARNSRDGDAAVLTAAAGESWGDVLARDVKLIHDHIGSFVLLPDWVKSRGARLEVFVGLLVGVQDFTEVKVLQGGFAATIYNRASVLTVRERIRENMP